MSLSDGWEDLKGYETRYKINKQGNVFSNYIIN